jgi:hypothetical protein
LDKSFQIDDGFDHASDLFREKNNERAPDRFELDRALVEVWILG